MHYRDEKLAIARAATAELCADPGIDSVYLAGSLPAGLGSPTSDVDVFAILVSEADMTAKQITADGERMDVETYTADWFRTALDKVENWEISRQDLRSKSLSDDELDALIRMRQMEVVKDSPTFRSFRTRLAENEQRLQQIALNKWALELNGHLSDFKGSYRDKDFTSAALIGQSLMLCAGKALTTATGDLYFGKKWVYRQMERSVGEGFPRDRFISYQTGAWVANDPGDLEFLTFAQTVTTAAQLLGWETREVNRWPFWSTGEGELRRNPQYNPIHLTKGVLLNNELQRQFVVKPDIALIWGLCNGREEDEVVEAAIDLHKAVMTEPGAAPLTAGRVREVIKVLHKRGLISDVLFR